MLKKLKKARENIKKKKEEKKLKKEEKKKTLEQHKKDLQDIYAQNIYEIKRHKIDRREIDLLSDLNARPKVYNPIFSLRGIPYISKGWRLRKKVLEQKDRFVLVRITSLNRAVREYFVPADINGFVYNRGRYIFDDSNKYWNATAKMWCYDYQEPVTLPISVRTSIPSELAQVIDDYNQAVSKGMKVDVDVERIKEIVETVGNIDVENAINPKVLETYLKSNFVQSLVEGASLGKIFRLIVIFLIGIALLLFILLVLNGWSSGLFTEIGNLFSKK